MNWWSLITFAIGLGVYFVGLGIFLLTKRLRNKKKFEKDIQDHKENNVHGSK